VTVPYSVGTMVETPRAALIAGQLAQIAQFLSFGTNDLTQLTYGFSRDDVEAQLLTAYVERQLLPVSGQQAT
jgi:pyruvate,orthophosphate dikinase